MTNPARSPLTRSEDARLVPVPAVAPVPRGGRRLRIIGRDSLEAAVTAAVDRALARLADLPPGPVRLALRRALRAELRSSLGRHGRRVRGMTRRQFLLELERARNTTLLARDRAREELIATQQELERARRLGPLVTVGAPAPDWNLGRLDAALGRVFARAREEGRGTAELEADVRALLHDHGEEELSRLLAEQTADYREQVDRFERRVRKLTRSLEEAEKALAELARVKSMDPGIASIYRTVQGLSPDDGLAQRKAEMLSQIFEANRELQAG